MSIVMNKVDSSQIHAIGHDPETNTLAIQFKRNGEPAATYHYQNFTRDDFEAFSGAKSIGSHFFKNIKHETEKHPYTKVA